MFETLKEKGANFAEMMVNLSAEYPVILDSIVVIFAGLGALLSLSGVVEFIRVGKAGGGDKGSLHSVFTKLIGGALLVDLMMTTKMLTASMWANHDPMGISEYVATGGGAGYSEQAIMAACGIIVIAGYVAIGRAYIGIAKLGKTPEEQRGDLWGFIISRLVSGSAMVSVLWLAELFGNSVS